MAVAELVAEVGHARATQEESPTETFSPSGRMRSLRASLPSGRPSHFLACRPSDKQELDEIVGRRRTSRHKASRCRRTSANADGQHGQHGQHGHDGRGQETDPAAAQRTAAGALRSVCGPASREQTTTSPSVFADIPACSRLFPENEPIGEVDAILLPAGGLDERVRIRVRGS